MIPIYTHYATFKGLSPDDSNSDKEGYISLAGLTGVPCNIQPVSANPAELSTGVFNKSHILYTDVTCSGVREGYQVIISGLYDGVISREFVVQGVEDWSKGPIPHYEINLMEKLP